MIPDNPDVDYILSNAERLVYVAIGCVISFALADGLQEAINVSHDEAEDWKQAVGGFQDDNLMMTVVRTALLLDREKTKVSFQAVHHRLKAPTVREGLLQVLIDHHGDDLLPPARNDLIDEFLQTYSEIDWLVYGRLKHFRNLGIAHLTQAKMRKSVTFDELRTLVGIISRLAATLQHLCQTRTALTTDMLCEYRDIARKTVTQGR